MATRKLTLGYLYPDIMSSYGDRGNIGAIMRRCGWRDIVTEILELRLGDLVHPDDIDIFVIGNGGESHQRLIAPDLADVKGLAIREAVDQGAALLAVGAGYELLGRFYQPSKGVELPGAGLFDAWTIQHGAGLGAASRTITEARADRAIGDLLVRWGDAGPGGRPRGVPRDAGPGGRPRGAPRDAGPGGRPRGAPRDAGPAGHGAPWDSTFPGETPEPPRPRPRWTGAPRDELLVGFENHGTRTYLGPTARALGQVVIGQGNNGDGREGVRLGGAVGTYLRGPCLPRNPVLADFLIRAALVRRYGEAEVEPLPDDLERAAHDAAVLRITTARAGNRQGLGRIGTRLGRVVLPPKPASPELSLM
jgi:CobQ-like glutamine amidotransferase family enzyme